MQITTSFAPAFDALYDKFQSTELGARLLSIEGISPEKLDISKMSQSYFTKRLADSSIDMNANSNEDMSANNYQAEIAKSLMKLDGYFLLWKYAAKRFSEERASELVSRIWDGYYYLHDASGPGLQIPYCFAFSTSFIVENGRPYGQLHSMPPKRADSFIAQIIEVCMDLSQEFAGAVAPSDILIYYAYYAKKENLSKEQIVNDLQKFVHVMNNKFRVSGQSPFTNVSLFDRQNLKVLCENIYYPDGSQPDIEYVIYIEKIFGEFFSKGDPKSNLPYRFPVVTINLAVDDDNNVIDEDFLDWSATVNLERGCFNIYGSEGSKIAMCCRFVNDFERLGGNIDSFGNGGTNIGSHRVITINLPRLALEAAGDVDKFNELLSRSLDDCRDILLVHREEILKRRIDQGFLKFFKPVGWFDLSMFFSTIGIIGDFEMTKFMGFDPYSEAGHEFNLDVLNKIDTYALSLTESTGWSFNIEQVPAESAAISLAAKDALRYYNEDLPFYSNQFVPLIADVDIIDRIEMTGKFMAALSGGGILHLNIQDKIQHKDQMKHLIRKVLKENVKHFAVNYGFGTCQNGHVTVCGNSSTCAICGAPIKSYLTRIIGYFTVVDNWGEIRLNKDFPFRKFK